MGELVFRGQLESILYLWMLSCVPFIFNFDNCRIFERFCCTVVIADLNLLFPSCWLPKLIVFPSK